MKIFRQLAIAFTLYSRIPMPHFTWKDEDLSDSLTFFPLVGLLIGGMIVLLNGSFLASKLPAAVRILLTLAIPLLITGGIHVDGFLDVEDALHSFAPPEEKQRILKDPHIGAFAIIGLVKWGLTGAAAVAAILLHPSVDTKTVLLYGLCFVVSRSLSALTALCFQKAKKEGMLYEETKGKKKLPIILLTVQLLLAFGVMGYLDLLLTGLILAGFGAAVLIYRNKSYREFGGVSGDTAGFFVTFSEILAAVLLGLGMYLFR